MKIIVGLGHPAHFHLFKNAIQILSNKNISFDIVISNKDILKDLLDNAGLKYEIIAESSSKETLRSKILKIFYSTLKLNKIVHEKQPDILIGCLSQLAFSGFIKSKHVLFFGEDDFRYTYLQGITVLPFVKNIIAPRITDLGPFNYKKIAYDGYQKLAYLRPNHFTPDENVLREAGVKKEEQYFVLRFSALNAYHDIGKQGLSKEKKRKLIELLKPHGKIFITTEGEIDPEFTEYQIKIEPLKIHSFLYYATMFIGDSQTMTSEAAMLGTPALRSNSFVGKISCLEEQEHKYELAYGFLPNDTDKLFKKIDELLHMPNLKQEWQQRRKRMLDDKIDVTAFIVWFVEHYPESLKLMKEYPDYQYRFRSAPDPGHR